MRAYEHPRTDRIRDNACEVLAECGEERKGQPVGDPGAGTGECARAKVLEHPVEPGEQDDDGQVADREPADRDPHDAQVVGEVGVHPEPGLEPGDGGAPQEKRGRREYYQRDGRDKDDDQDGSDALDPADLVLPQEGQQDKKRNQSQEQQPGWTSVPPSLAAVAEDPGDQRDQGHR